MTNRRPHRSMTDDAVPLRGFGVGLVVLGVIGLLAAFTLTVDKFRLLEDPSFVPSCNLNPVLSCGSVMVTDQASAFGFPNPLLGLIGVRIVIIAGPCSRPARGCRPG